MKRVMFISSTGGHLTELLQLKELFNEYDSYIVTEKTTINKKLCQTYPGKVNFLIFGGKEHFISYLYKFPFNVMKSFILFLKIHPDVIITTGAHTAVPMCYWGKLFRKKIIYIETFANIHTKSLSGKLCYPIADLFIVQWESMLSLYPNAIYVGGVF